MEKRIGTALIVVENQESVHKLNQIITNHNNIIISRTGIPLRDKGVSIISLVLEGTTNEISSLSGQLGKLMGINVKTLVMKTIFND